MCVAKEKNNGKWFLCSSKEDILKKHQENKESYIKGPLHLTSMTRNFSELH